MSEENKAPQKPMSIEQAGNLLKEKKDLLTTDYLKKQAKQHPISCAMPEDRKRYLAYGISLLQDVSETTKYTWCKIANKAAVCYTTKEIASILRTVLALRTEGFSYNHIAKHIGVLPDVVKKTEQLALNAVKDIIAIKRQTSTPLIGGLN